LFLAVPQDQAGFPEGKRPALRDVSFLIFCPGGVSEEIDLVNECALLWFQRKSEVFGALKVLPAMYDFLPVI
jgi:hypothetical protein